jgi:hypothetical protein
MKPFFKIVLFFVSFYTVSLCAQGLPDNGNGGSDPDVPVDGGIVTVVGGAIYFGMKQLRKKQQDSE